LLKLWIVSDRIARTRQKVLFLALIIFLVAGASAATLREKCVAVTDGDTIKVLVNQQIIEVRLNGVDAPEKKQPIGT
jgi:endonuclease YncB( thermonuclease family)